MRRLLFFLLILLLMVSCRLARESNTSVGGNIGRASGRLLKLEEVGPGNSITLDSVILDESGNFTFRFVLKETGLYLLSLTGNNRLVLELRPGDTLRIISSDGSKLQDAMITGSVSSSDMKQFFDTTFRNRKIYDSLQSSLITYQDDPDFAELSKKLDESLKPIWENQRALETAYIERHLNSLTSLLILNQGIGTSPVLTFHTDSVYFLKLDSSLGRAFTGNKHAVFHHNRILQERALESMKK
jgi:hypothetical protein